MMFLWIIDHLPEIFWTLITWIFLAIAFCVAWYCTRKAWIIRHPVWEEDPEWHYEITDETFPTIVELRDLPGEWLPMRRKN